jgi:CrcB protein
MAHRSGAFLCPFVLKNWSFMTIESLALLGGIGIAGAVGAVVRYIVGRFVAERAGATFPLGTLLINVTGAFLIALIFALTAKKLIPPTLQSLLATGFLGGYTTFSTMSWEGTQLARGGNNVRSILYFGSTFVFGISAGILGLVIGQLL